MDKKERVELHSKAWDLLEEKGVTLGERMMIRSAFVEWSGYKDANPFIDTIINKGEPRYYHSTHEMIRHLLFEKESEVVLANAIYMNMNESCSIDEFREVLKYTFRLMRIENGWT